MDKHEWNFIKCKVESCLPEGAKVLPHTNVIDSLPDGLISQDEWIDRDYDDGKILKITMGPFAREKEIETYQCLDRIKGVLTENGYEIKDVPFGSIDGENIIVTIRFTRTESASLHILDEENKK